MSFCFLEPKVCFCLLRPVTEEGVGQGSSGFSVWAPRRAPAHRSSLSTRPGLSIRWDGLASGWNAALMSSPWSESAA